jgi:hypothetical protein
MSVSNVQQTISTIDNRKTNFQQVMNLTTLPTAVLKNERENLRKKP